jgi:MFS family permease
LLVNAVPSQRRTRRAGLGANYRKLWLAHGVSNLGDGVTIAALPLLAATLTRDPAVFAGVTLAGRLPWLLFALIAGALTDRLDRRRIMGWVQAARFGLVMLLAVAAAGGWASIAMLYALAFALGICETLFDNASQTIMPSLVTREDLERANGRLYAVELVANQFAGPPLGALLFTLAVGLPFILDATTFAAAAVLILTIGGTFRVEREPAARSSIRSEIAEGLRWLWRNRLLRTLALMLGALNLTETATLAIFPLFALEILEVGEVGYGVLLVAFAVGSFIGTLVADRLIAGVGRGTLLLAVVVSLAAADAVTGISSSAIVVGLMLALIGFCSILWNIITVSLRQTIIPGQLLGRVNSVYRFLGWGAMPIGAVVGGVLAAAYGLRAPFFFSAATTLVVLFAALPFVNTRTIEAARRSPGEG